MIVAAVIIPAVLFYPAFAFYLPEGVRDFIATASGGLLSVEIVEQAAPQVSVIKPAPPLPAPRPTAMATLIVLTSSAACFLYYWLNRFLEVKTQAWRRPAGQS